jgi:hypothetical protein
MERRYNRENVNTDTIAILVKMLVRGGVNPSRWAEFTVEAGPEGIGVSGEFVSVAEVSAT